MWSHLMTLRRETSLLRSDSAAQSDNACLSGAEQDTNRDAVGCRLLLKSMVLRTLQNIILYTSTHHERAGPDRHRKPGPEMDVGHYN